MIRYLDMNGIGALFGTSGGTVAKWRKRYEASHPCPEPDAMVGPSPGWLPAREQEWRDWEKNRPGQTSGLKRGR